MRFPATISIIRPTGLDEYGNPDTSFTAATSISARALRVSATVLLVDPAADLRVGDRISVGGTVYSQEATPVLTPRGTKCISVTLTALAVQP
jgi:hypothetical protein